MAIDPIRPTDDTARHLGVTLLRTARAGSLATLGADGHPFASLTSLATDIDGTPVILVSALSGHTTNLARDPRAALLLAETGKGDPLAHPRITLKVTAREVEAEGPEGARLRRRFLARHPKAQLYVDFPDFRFLRLELMGASLNGGFGKAYELKPADLLAQVPADFEVLEASAVAHMNEDHAEAAALYATKLAGGPGGSWRVTGIDPLGIDLALGDLCERIAFDAPAGDAASLRATLAALAERARAT